MPVPAAAGTATSRTSAVASAVERQYPRKRRSLAGVADGRKGWLGADDLDEPAPVALAVQLDEEHPLPLPQREDAVAHRDRLAGRPEQHRHAVGVAVPELLVLLA